MILGTFVGEKGGRQHYCLSVCTTRKIKDLFTTTVYRLNRDTCICIEICLTIMSTSSSESSVVSPPPAWMLSREPSRVGSRTALGSNNTVVVECRHTRAVHCPSALTVIVRQLAASGAGVAAALISSISVIHHAVQFVNKGPRPAYLVLFLHSDLFC